MSCQCCNKVTRPGYSSFTNSLAQTIGTNSVVNLGHLVASSEAENITTLDGRYLTVEHTGTYYIDMEIIATPTASSVVTLSLDINGYHRAIVSLDSTATPGRRIYQVRGVFYMFKGDTITLVNLGAATLTMNPAQIVNEYNTSVVIERFN